MSENGHPGDGEPKADEYATHIEEPSTEKEPDEEPEAPEGEKPPPSHDQAVGIGVVGRPQTDEALRPTADVGGDAQGEEEENNEFT